MRRFVSRKCPMWLLPNCASMPSAVFLNVFVIIPALLMMMSSLGVNRAISAAASRTEAWDPRSRSTVLTLTFECAFWMSLATCSSFDCVREARMRMEGDWEAIARAVEEPIDSGLTPVMRTENCR